MCLVTDPPEKVWLTRAGEGDHEMVQIHFKHQHQTTTTNNIRATTTTTRHPPNQTTTITLRCTENRTDSHTREIPTKRHRTDTIAPTTSEPKPHTQQPAAHQPQHPSRTTPPQASRPEGTAASTVGELPSFTSYGTG